MGSTFVTVYLFFVLCGDWNTSGEKKKKKKTLSLLLGCSFESLLFLFLEWPACFVFFSKFRRHSGEGPGEAKIR
jgi:hypothetical protein